jgi:hypothetical protein
MDENSGNGNVNQGQQSGESAQSGEKRRWPEPVSPGYPGAVFIDGQYWRPEDTDAWMQMRKDQRAERERKNHENWLQTPPGKLCLEFYQKFQEYKKYLEEHPYQWGGERGRQADFTEHKLFELGLREIQRQREEREERDRMNLQRAQLAARCEHVHNDGQRCGCPRVKGAKLCYMHQRLEEARALKLDLGPLEDADSIQVGIKKLQKAVIDETLSDKQVRQLTNLLQIATWNVTRMKFANREVEEG